jgi:acid phosphatase
MAFVALAISVVAGACAGGNATATAALTPTPVAATPASTLTPSTPMTASATGSGTAAVSPTPSSGLPDFRHVYVIILENREYSSIVGSSAAPYINSLIAQYGQATNLYAETHPSEPNYIALTSGGLQGTNSDGAYNLGAPNLFDQIETSGRTWHVYAQSYPGSCYLGSVAGAVADGPGAPGDYARKHNPAISYTSISGKPTRCANITKLAGFDPTAADFEMIVPNQINDMHSSSVGAGDAFLKDFVPQITSSPAFADSVLFITWDEGSSSLNGGGHIATIVASPNMTPGSRFEGPATHYSMLRTIELAWGMPLLGEAQKASTLTLPY